MDDNTKKSYNQYTLEDFISDPFFAGYVNKSDTEAMAFWPLYIVQHPEQRPLIEEAVIIAKGLQFKKRIIPTDSVETEWNRLSMLIDQSEKKRRSTYRLKIAASVIALVFFTAFALLLVFRSATIEVRTAYGEIKQITMPDGSAVMLNANSMIRYEDNWNESSLREVWLVGEAFFNVRRKNSPSARFVVYSNSTRVEVLGTQFNVNNRSGKTTVVLNTGKVVLRNDIQKDTIVMKPGDLITFAPNTNKITRKRVNPVMYSAWKDRKFIFNETPLRDVTRLIEENFGMKVIVKSESLNNRKLSGEIMVDNIDVLLEALSKSFGIHVVRNHDTITLEEKI